MSSKKELIRQVEILNAEVKYWEKMSESHQEDARLLCSKNELMQRKIDYLEDQLNNDEKYKDLLKYIEQQDLKIASLIKQRDNWKADCEYNEECFQAEREARYKLEDEIKVLKGEKKYPCISLNCNDITGESFSLYFCFSYDERVLLANNVPKYICKDKFIIGTSLNFKGELIYHIGYVEPIIDSLHTMWRLEVDINSSSRNKCKSTIPLNWMNYCNNKSNKDIEDKKFQRYCFLGAYNCLNVCLSEMNFIMLDRNPEPWIQKSDRWKILYDSNTKNGLVQIYDKSSLKAVTYYIAGNNVKKVIGEQV